MKSVMVHGVPVYGVDVDAQTRCAHYHSDVDVIAIKFPCCSRFYPCHLCHDTVADHAAKRWPVADFDQEAVLCGACGNLLTINTYLSGDSTCPHCLAHFNPGCKTHRHLYFKD